MHRHNWDYRAVLVALILSCGNALAQGTPSAVIGGPPQAGQFSGILSPANGGTGVNNGTSTLTFGANNFLTAPAGINGTSGTSNATMFNIGGTENGTPGAGASIYGLRLSTTLSSAGTLGFIFGEYLRPVMTGSNGPTTSFVVSNNEPVIDSGFVGAIQNVLGVEVGDLNNSSGIAAPVFDQFIALLGTNGNGVTSGTIANRSYTAGGWTASAAAGGVVNNDGYYTDMPSGSGAGTTANYGFRVHGSGGSGGGGTTTNFPFYSDDAADLSLIAGGWKFTGGTLPTVSPGAGYVLATATGGLVMAGNGSSHDWELYNKSGAITCDIPTGTSGLSCGRFIPSASTLSGNEFYLPGANTPAVAANGTKTQDWTSTLSTIYVGFAANSTIVAPNLATSSAATTGTLCWTTGTGNVNVDTTVACLASDERLKNVSPFTPSAPFKTACGEEAALVPINYTWKHGTPKFDADPGEHIGLGAFNTAYADERLIARGEDGQPRGWRQDAMIALGIACRQEQQKQLADLERRIAR